jgi:hypothetical protein
MKKDPRFTIQVGKERLSLRAPQADPAVAQESLALVQRFIEDAEARSKQGAPSFHITLLALLDLAEEYVLARKLTEEWQQEIAKRTGTLLDSLELRPLPATEQASSEPKAEEGTAPGLATAGRAPAPGTGQKPDEALPSL